MDDDRESEEATQPPTLDLSYKELQGTSGSSEGTISIKQWLFEKRLDYAQKFFTHHAKQRMDMFNYFLVFAGFALAAFANMFKDQDYVTSSIVAFFASILTYIFMFLDRRNEELVHISEDVLEALEFDVLFANFNRKVRWPRRRNFWGIMPKCQFVRPLGIFRRQTADIGGSLCDKAQEDDRSNPQHVCRKGESRYAHGRWMPWFQFGICLLFFILAVISLVMWARVKITILLS